MKRIIIDFEKGTMNKKESLCDYSELDAHELGLELV